MAKSRKNGRLVALDMGSETVRAVVAERTEKGLDIIGAAKAKSSGLQKGNVIDIASTSAAVDAVINDLRVMCGQDVHEVLCSISGSHISGLNNPAVVSVTSGRVTEKDKADVIAKAQEVRLPLGREIFHVAPTEYAVDENDGVKGPVGMSGVRLEAKVHMVTAAKAQMDNIRTCCDRSKVKVSHLVYSGLAVSEAVLHQDEKELGVIVADIGAGTTDIAVWHNGAVIQTAVIPLGGAAITNDIATGLRTPRREAERLKMEYGCALASMVSEEETMEVPSVGGREPAVLKRALLAEIIEPRMEEIFTQIAQEIQRAGNVDRVSSGLVMTGGTALIPGMVELGSGVLGLGVRVGHLVDPDQVFGGLSTPIEDESYMVCLGILTMADRGHLNRRAGDGPEEDGRRPVGDSWWKRLWNSIRRIFAGPSEGAD
jgi:cell division protein FtsA